MKSENFESVKLAKKVAKAQLKWYNSMMAEKEAKEDTVTNKKLYLVDTIVTFRHKYVIEADALEHAYDEVTMRDSGADEDNFEELTQRYLGETITDGREISKKEFKKILKELETDRNELSSHWLGGDKLIRKINYNR